MNNLSAIAADLPDMPQARWNTILPSTTLEKAALCPDWILSNNSNVNTAVDRGWFTTYTPYNTYTIDDVFGGNPTPVYGIGTVTIQVLKHKVNKGKRSQRTITLHDVLHTPTSICNTVGRPFLVENEGIMSFADGVLRSPDGSIIAFFEPRPIRSTHIAGALAGSGLLCLKLLHAPSIRFAASKLEPSFAYMIRATWPDAERMKYINDCNATATTAASRAASATTPSRVPPLTAEEKHWLKHISGHKDEFHLLRDHGLSIYKDEDREEGRQILRALMADDDCAEEDADEDEDDEWDPTGHQADYAFKAAELEFIEKHWGTSENFLMTHGVKFYDDEDLEEGRAIVRAFMAE